MSYLSSSLLVYGSIFVGGGIGATLRYFSGYVVSKLIGNADFPYSTLIINVLGSFLMGLIVSYFTHTEHHQEVRLFLTVGILGGFTTFSAFSFETISLWQRGEPILAASYLILSVLLSLFAFFLGNTI